MSSGQKAKESLKSRYMPKKRAIFGMWLLFFIILAAIALALCNFRVQYATQSILNQQHGVQQTWLDKSLDSIRVWRNELVEQARRISSSEMLRLFIMDAKNLNHGELENLQEPDSLHSPDESIRSMAEQLTYIQDLLHDFTARRAWNDARILLPDGYVLVSPQFAAPVSEAQKELAREAAQKGRYIFGPIRQGEKGLTLDMADPLFDVLGSDQPRVVAVLLLSVPMDKPLANFLARTGERKETLLPRIINQDGDTLAMALIQAGNVALEPVGTSITRLENMPFMLRKSLDDKMDVYSMGAMPTILRWLFVLETPASEVKELIHAQKMQIYGLGILASIGIALLAAWIWARNMSRRHEAEAARYEKLYNTIRNQKLMLDSINSSFQAGLLLVDTYGRVQMSNPAFWSICGQDMEIPANTPLVEALRGKPGLSLLQNMSLVNELGQSASIEITVNGRDDQTNGQERLYRVSLFPYSDNSDKDKNGGCVAIFQDITEFRRKAEQRRKRQASLISALGRAIESVDPNLVGHSDKMAGISNLLAKELNMNPTDTETLDLAARLSQIGKIFVPRELLTKKGKLTPEELQEIRKAPEYGDKILHDLHFDLPVSETVRLIGERVDGSGKPLGLKANDISLCGKALAVVNAFIAMTSPRAWRADNGMSIEKAISQITNDQGFDRNVAAALAKLSKQDIEKALDIKTDQASHR